MSFLTSALFFVWFLVAFVGTVNALRRPVPPGRRFPPLWLPGMLVSELAPLLFVLGALAAGGFWSVGAHQSTLGQMGVGLFLLSEVGLVVLMVRTVRSARETGHSPPVWSLFEVGERPPPDVQFSPHVHYWNGLTLDVHARPGLADAPVLLYLHPGSWMRGRPGRQARPLLYSLAGDGWLVLDIRYPLSPRATFPDHLTGVKRAIAWAKEEGVRWGGDPQRVAVAGASSGAHLAALAALTHDRPDLQPGFEEAEVDVAACVVFYGIYDLLVRNPTRYDWPFIARHVMKAKPAEAPRLYRLGSPIDQVRSDAPPFLVVHGEFDSVVLPQESRHFAEALERVGAPVRHHEVRGAQHGFDAVASLRTRAVGEMTRNWLNGILLFPGHTSRNPERP